MYQFHFLFLGVNDPQGLNQPQAHPAAAMHGQPRGLVENEKLVILIDAGTAEPLGKSAADHRWRLGFTGTDRRDTHHIATGQPGSLFGAPFIHPHFPGADNPVDTGFGHPFEVGEEEIVQALTVTAFVDGHEADTIRCGGLV